jgi:hypothetical protein
VTCCCCEKSDKMRHLGVTAVTCQPCGAQLLNGTRLKEDAARGCVHRPQLLWAVGGRIMLRGLHEPCWLWWCAGCGGEAATAAHAASCIEASDEQDRIRQALCQKTYAAMRDWLTQVTFCSPPGYLSCSLVWMAARQRRLR